MGSSVRNKNMEIAMTDYLFNTFTTEQVLSTD